LRRVRTGECGPVPAGAGGTATLFLPRVLVLLLVVGKLKQVARAPPLLVQPCPIAISSPLLVKPCCCWG
jgi:hypothetical protein